MFRRVTSTVLASAVAAILIVPATSVSAQEGGPIAPELTGLGTLHMPVTTSVPQAQRFFDQGLRLLYAFNHAEAIRAFREAARLDPGLAMAYWGWAIALGPNLNAPMSQENGRQAYSAIRQARALSSRATPREQALIEALSLRYSADGKGDRAALDRAYAGAMQKAAGRFEDDPDVQTIFVDAQMNTMPWDYWQKDGTAKPETARILTVLETVIARQPDHAGALHYHIHLLEASADPDRAAVSADRLGSLMPSAGHMVHMPAHIYIRVGRYADAAEANVKAIAADEDALKRLCGNYIDNVKAYTQKEKVKNRFTGKSEDPDERLMRSIEEKIDIPESRKDDFRREIMNYIGALSIDGKTFDYKTNERLYKALELKLFEDQKDSIKLTSLVSNVVDAETQQKIDVVKGRLIRDYGYDDESATDVLNYVASIFARGDAKENK